MKVYNYINLIIMMFFTSIFLTGCNQEFQDNVEKQVNSGTLKIIDFLAPFLMFFGLIVLANGIYNVFINDKHQRSSNIENITKETMKIGAGIILVCIKPISHYMLG